MIISIVIIFLEDETNHPVVSVLIALLALFIFILFIKSMFGFIEMAYVEHISKRLFYNHIYLKKSKLDAQYQYILRTQFKFYNRLNKQQQSYFQHRMHYFISTKQFIGKGVIVTDEMKALMAATATKITFGLRDYKIDLLDKILIYPDTYFSTYNGVYHKGEFNPAYGALVFSWKHVAEGYQIQDDNLNLAIHEFVHAVHFNYLQNRGKSSSAAIFLNTFNELSGFLNDQHQYRNNLLKSDYFRPYAHTNQFELLAVLIENFIETPTEFQQLFPEVYAKIKQMLNFNFYGY